MVLFVKVPLYLKCLFASYKCQELQADQICYAVLCVFSYVAAGNRRRKTVGAGKGGSSGGGGGNFLNHTVASGSISPRGPRFSTSQ